MECWVQGTAIDCSRFVPPIIPLFHYSNIPPSQYSIPFCWLLATDYSYWSLPFSAQILIFSPVMGKFKRFKNQTFAKVYTKIPSLVDLYAKQGDLVVNTTIPFTPLKKPLEKCRISLVTTGGLHTKTQQPFDMADKKGDPSYREIPADITPDQLTVTHDYYNHADALADPNLVLPIEPLRQLLKQGTIGSIGPRFFSFMGHIMGDRLKKLTQERVPEVAAALIGDGVEAAFLTPT
jgi:D-proline reductase (dithiol) PrdB